ncbi:relaxase/mobilization nuclease domain-containing protein [Sinomicrobium weinanense]|uniref:Relaxase/mobilization nuclease domain-containing protein n=1 Tax=Sinomicrobium weinanense TaxID=2842200 RepID=A0A926JTI7_9FLAO|nr:relaxase/mobilization nuclease domain-containing protein [Sinomicrobium weinanense]MBC9797039.1 relaxase/mobilization nuclease domain-containing protein [Sinomicrobium weinanense]MBU3122034.1 relaxase/mobilization nuclease domain-containing protein [Sinomicrobium weinanense]
MVAILKPGKSLKQSFYYNENKVKEGIAEYLWAENYHKTTAKLSQEERLLLLEKQAGLNPDVKVNSLHITLNFDPSEHLSNKRLITIAKDYMHRLGFGNQPYLVYRHYDAGHPHVHLLTTNIEADGKRISLHHLGIRKSEPARKAIEENFGLVKAESQKQADYKLQPVVAQRVQYGKSATKKAIQNVLVHVLDTYKYASLPELNAILNQYNITADRGQENSRMYRNGGLVYKILDTQGKPIGVPIKASLFYNKPTLKSLKKKFLENKQRKARDRLRLKNTIDKILLRKENIALSEFVKVLSKQGIHTVLRQNEEGRLYGITYVDHRTQSVFNGSELGKPYGAKAMQERLGLREVSEPNIHSARKPGIGLQPQHTAAETKDISNAPEQITSEEPEGHTETVLDQLLQVEQVPDYLPYHLKKHRKKKKRKKG